MQHIFCHNKTNAKIKNKPTPFRMDFVILPECAVKPHPLGWGYQARTAKQSNQC